MVGVRDVLISTDASETVDTGSIFTGLDMAIIAPADWDSPTAGVSRVWNGLRTATVTVGGQTVNYFYWHCPVAISQGGRWVGIRANDGETEYGSDIQNIDQPRWNMLKHREREVQVSMAMLNQAGVNATQKNQIHPFLTGDQDLNTFLRRNYVVDDGVLADQRGRILFKTDTRANLNVSNMLLGLGQPFFDRTRNYLHVGNVSGVNLSEARGTPPIAVRELNAFSSDINDVGAFVPSTANQGRVRLTAINNNAVGQGGILTASTGFPLRVMSNDGQTKTDAFIKMVQPSAGVKTVIFDSSNINATDTSIADSVVSNGNVNVQMPNLQARRIFGYNGDVPQLATPTMTLSDNGGSGDGRVASVGVNGTLSILSPTGMLISATRYIEEGIRFTVDNSGNTIMTGDLQVRTSSASLFGTGTSTSSGRVTITPGATNGTPNISLGATRTATVNRTEITNSQITVGSNNALTTINGEGITIGGAVVPFIAICRLWRIGSNQLGIQLSASRTIPNDVNGRARWNVYNPNTGEPLEVFATSPTTLTDTFTITTARNINVGVFYSE
jgi:hypothetical protein